MRPPGAKATTGSKLARPMGSGMRPPGGTGLRKPSPQPSLESPKPPARQSLPAHVRQANKIQPQAVKPVHPVTGNHIRTANAEQDLEIGDWVLVNGKHGVLAFLGATQFAKGNWAGIILDSLEGKNSGSVNGIQYFNCEPNRGLFSKPEKIKFVSRGSHSTGGQSKPAPAPANNQGEVQFPFGVGDRVLVDGQREGTVGFLGTAQFARGVWAGIILDTPDGKNDGVVSGVRYFECEQNHGLFTRPQKLRLVSKAASDGYATPQGPSAKPQSEEENRSSQPTPVDLKTLHDKLKVGDQVLVGGVKEGVLRYLGPTEFAKGVWVGVELPEPMGKNDGAVSGKR